MKEQNFNYKKNSGRRAGSAFAQKMLFVAAGMAALLTSCSTTKTMVVGKKGEGVNIPWSTTNGAALYGLNTGCTLTLPPGKWLVYVQMVMAVADRRVGSDKDYLNVTGHIESAMSMFLQTSFSDSPDNPTVSKDIVGAMVRNEGVYTDNPAIGKDIDQENGNVWISGKYQGAADFTSPYSILQGNIIINNTGSAAKTYYYFVYGTQGSTLAPSPTIYLALFGGRYWGENVIIATRVKS